MTISVKILVNKKGHLKSSNHFALELDHLHVRHHRPVLFVQHVQGLCEEDILSFVTSYLFNVHCHFSLSTLSTNVKSSFYPHVHYHNLCDVPEPLNGELSPLVNRARVVRCCHSHEFATLCSNIFSLQNIICGFRFARTRTSLLSLSLFIRLVPNHHHQQHSASC